jgi:DNA-binding beta-propeller fold protein YncE
MLVLATGPSEADQFRENATMNLARAIHLLLAAAALLLPLGLTNSASAKPFMIVGLDEKILWDDDGKPVLSPDGKDQVLIVDLANPEDPKITASLPLKNSIVGPPVNLDIDPSGTVALVADSIDDVKDGDNLKQMPDNKIYVIDMAASPPKLAATLTGGKQPSGLSFSPDGKMALVANRGDNTISVLSVDGTNVKITDTVAMPDSVAQVVFTPDGKRALAARYPAHKLSILDIADGKVTYSKLDLPTGQWPYNVVVSPDGKIALTADNGGSGASDGSVDTTSVVDLEANPPRIIDRVVVGDGPEGMAMSPKGDIAVAAILRGSNASKKAYFYNKNGSLSILKIDGKKVTKTQDIEVGGLPEAVLVTPDGKYILAGNFLTEDFSILKVDDGKVTDTGKRFKVPGHPASARMGH